MSDWAEKLSAKLRESVSPVSAFFLIDSSASIGRMVERLRALCAFGVPADRVEAVGELARHIWARYTAADEVKERVWFEFDVPAPDYPNGRPPGCVTIQAIPRQGFEAELVLPGVVAAGASGLVGDGRDGCFCAFLPPTCSSLLYVEGSPADAAPGAGAGGRQGRPTTSPPARVARSGRMALAS